MNCWSVLLIEKKWCHAVSCRHSSIPQLLHTNLFPIPEWLRAWMAGHSTKWLTTQFCNLLGYFRFAFYNWQSSNLFEFVEQFIPESRIEGNSLDLLNSDQSYPLLSLSIKSNVRSPIDSILGGCTISEIVKMRGGQSVAAQPMAK